MASASTHEIVEESKNSNRGGTLRSATYLRPTEWDERQVYYRPHILYSQVVLYNVLQKHTLVTHELECLF